MGLEFRWHADGRLRDTWFGSYQVNGKRFALNLGVKIGGAPPAPPSLKVEGDAAFERSKATALAKLDSIIEESRSKRDSARLVEKLYEIKTGEQVRSVKLDKLHEEWAGISRKRKLDERYAEQCKATLRRFVEFVRRQNAKADEIAHVTNKVAQAFMEAESAREVGPKTWNDTLKLLRATFKYLLPAGAINPFYNMVTKETETIFRKPFTPEELKAIQDAAKQDDFIRPILVTGMCTAMRRGDCCLLKWKDVDLKRGFITVKTAKTGQTVSIPIFPLLFDELEKQASATKNGDRNAYVFPERAAMYLENPDGITWRVKKVLAVALGGLQPVPDALPEASESETRRRGEQYITSLPESDKRNRMLKVFDLYMGQKKTSEIVAEAGVSKGSVSGYLNEIEAQIGCSVVRGRGDSVSVTAVIKNGNGLLNEARENGERKASIRDFHSFRVTWVTLALTAGVPLELVQKVTGHKTTDIVLKHYFQPGREEFRQALQSAMPKLLTNGHKSGREEMKEAIQQVKPKALRERLLKLLDKV